MPVIHFNITKGTKKPAAHVARNDSFIRRVVKTARITGARGDIAQTGTGVRSVQGREHLHAQTGFTPPAQDVIIYVIGTARLRFAAPGAQDYILSIRAHGYL